MRSSNRKAVLWLLKNGYDDIWLKAHGRRLDLIYTTGEWYRALDLWNLYDGICFDDIGRIILIQIKTNSWAKAEPIREFLKSKKKVSSIEESTIKDIKKLLIENNINCRYDGKND